MSDEMSSGMVVLGELGETSFGILVLGELDETSFGIFSWVKQALEYLCLVS